LKSERNLAERTIKRNQHYLVPFLEDLGPDVARERLPRLSPSHVERFFVKHSEKVGPESRRGVQAFLRTFLRFCLKRGYLERDLSQAVPKIRKYKLSHVPRGPSEEEIRKILGGIDRTTPVGRRDFAILQLLASYGVRGGQVRALKLEDIQWREERIRFSAMKGGKEVLEPLTEEVGESLLDYLRHGRPEATYPEVFLTARPPFKPLTDPSTVTLLARQRMRRAGVSGYPMGSHAFRHAFATCMLKKGQSLKTIADMLGHRNINTTFIYTKVDLVALRQLPLLWPEV
jgi:site-specific recombinase XerD